MGSWLSTALSGIGVSRAAVDGSARTASALVINPGALPPYPGWVDGVDAVFRSVDQLAFTIITGHVCLFETVDGRDLADFGLVQIAGYPRPTAALLNAVAEYLRHHRVRAVNAGGVAVPTKLFRCVRFALAGLPVPATVYLPHRLLTAAYADLERCLGQPFVLKAMTATGGRYNYLVSNGEDLARHLRDPGHKGLLFLAQELIPNGTTYRVLVFGGDTPVVIRRTAGGGTHLTGPAHGGPSSLVDPADVDPVALRLAARAAFLIGSDLAAVTMIQHWTTRQWYVLDTSTTPPMGVGEFTAETLAAYSSYLKRRLAA